jgi:uncharacterized protein YndB with AHSA1/START domain
MSTHNGTIQTRDDGTRVLRFERRLTHPIDRVWAALTEPHQIEGWLARAELDLAVGGRVRLEWLNTDQDGNQAIAEGTISRLEPPRTIELDTDIHGQLLWELRPDGDATLLSLTVTASPPDDYLAKVMAGWHVHVDFLADFLDGHPIDWPNWPFERWAAVNEHYEAELAAKSP